MADQLTPSTAIPIKVVQVDQSGAFLSGSAVTIADNGNIVQGALADAAIVTDTTGTINGKIRGLVKWAFERMPASLGQKAMTASLPVVLASDQASVPVAATLAAETTKVIGTVNVAAAQAITANAGTNLNTSLLALDATLTGGTQKAIARGAAKGVTTAGDATTTAASTDRQPIDVTIYTAAGVAKDPTAIRALTSADVVSAAQSGTWTVQPGNTANTTPWLASVHDGTNKAAVKAAAVAVNADNPLVVTIHPLSAPTTAQPVSGTVTAAQATAANLLATVTQGPAAAASGAWMAKVTDGTNVGAVKAASILAVATDPSQVVTQSPMRADASTLFITATAAVNTASTATLPAPAAGLFHYITSVELVKLYSVIGVAAGAGVIVTSTNLPGNPAWTTEQLASAAGTATRVINYVPTTPLKSSVAATATTFVAPLQLQTIWRWNISYYTAP